MYTARIFHETLKFRSILYIFDLLIFPSYLLGYFLYTAFIDLTNIGFIDR